MNTTDYTENIDSIRPPVTPSRFGSYLLDLVKQWFSDSRNLIYSELSGLTYIDGDTQAAVKESNVFMDIEWPDSQKLADKTPSVIVTFGSSRITALGLGSRVYVGHTKFTGEQRTYDWSFELGLGVRTQAYAGSQYITELLALYLSTNRHEIIKDSGLADFSVNGTTAPVLQRQPGDSKDVFYASILCMGQSKFTATVDTPGPTFRKVTIVNTQP